ncbi:carbohydrate ABC transporter permease [Actinoplanes xinjiangensis]|jgi:raffinose/stachyose/melibiose transport system permease protein|uniref:Carbohydrate ABC transporter membrane protein 1 (CUT1 family) n=1 Tax=Actinoplanes xinjiangensis TaxID=512350 RepID=A0A316EM52_9ACTN|nr:sugar ABC transporter permease [Actinoplanes xinjiangensis]PWK32015.1 carbohydrate ABC transporter membrane protein 1 (CUT1 family) [Actinoplanes xinjiangensis]GIF43693.1 ABC transporter permease [Actinoplanes xinjiangensis]
MTTVTGAVTEAPATTVPEPARRTSPYPYWFILPGGVIFTVFFLVPSVMAFWFSLTRWTLFDQEFIGLDNYVQFFREPALSSGLRHTLVYAVTTSGLKVVLGMALAVLLTGPILGRGFMRSVAFFPVLVSTIGVGLTFQILMHPTRGVINQALDLIGITGPAWLVDPDWALLSVAFVDVWQGVGLATVIYMAGILSIPGEYFEAAKMDGAGAWHRFRNITLPLAKPATVSVILLSLIGGLRKFDLIWAMTKGGPGFTSDVMASVIYKQYQAGFYGLSTAGNVVLFLLVILIALPLFWFFNRRDDQ